MENEKKTAEKQAETVTISRAEYEELKLQNQWLLEQLGLAKKTAVWIFFRTDSGRPHGPIGTYAQRS